VGNGDIWEYKDAKEMRQHTGVRGVMAARGLLAKYVETDYSVSEAVREEQSARRSRSGSNQRLLEGSVVLTSSPALFAGYDKTPIHAVEQFVNISKDYGFIFPLLSVILTWLIISG
jgi:tRNA-dihydrouridine synthase 4